MLHDISLALRAGEIVGLAGLVGAGRTELCRALFGVDRIDSGRVYVDGKPVDLRDPGHAVAAGIALIPEDRGRDGLARQLPISYNVTAASLGKLSRWGVLRRGAEHAVTSEYIGRLRIKCSSGPSVGRPAERRQSAESRDCEVAGARREGISVR